MPRPPTLGEKEGCPFVHFYSGPQAGKERGGGKKELTPVYVWEEKCSGAGNTRTSCRSEKKKGGKGRKRGPTEWPAFPTETDKEERKNGWIADPVSPPGKRWGGKRGE